MKKYLLISALLLLVVGGSFWAARGAHRGWSRTSTAVKTVDEVTGIEGIEYRKEFVPGVNFIGAAAGAAALLAVSSFLIKNKK